MKRHSYTVSYEGSAPYAYWSVRKLDNLTIGAYSGKSFGDETAARQYLADVTSGPECVKCGDWLAWDRGYTGWEQREAAGDCFSCDYWRRLSRRSDGVIIDGYHYQIEPDKPRGYRGFIGHGGSPFTIRFNDGREVKTCNLWAQGVIPPAWRDEMKDNAVFVKAPTNSAHVGAGSAAGAPCHAD